MIGRVFAWALCLGMAYGGVVAYRHWSNPWSSVTASPVLSQLPPASNGCGEKCK